MNATAYPYPRLGERLDDLHICYSNRYKSEWEPVLSNVLETFYNIKIFIKFEHIPGTRTMVLMSRKNYLMTLIYRILNL